jgi:hypothetical protein
LLWLLCLLLERRDSAAMHPVGESKCSGSTVSFFLVEEEVSSFDFFNLTKLFFFLFFPTNEEDDDEEEEDVFFDGSVSLSSFFFFFCFGSGTNASWQSSNSTTRNFNSFLNESTVTSEVYKEKGKEEKIEKYQ